MNLETARKAALARVAEFTNRYPTTTQVPYRRLVHREIEIFALIAKENPEYFGESAVGTVDNGAVDLADITAPVLTPELVTRINVKTLAVGADPVALGFDVGDEITIVTIADPDGVPPRATLRNKVLRGIGTDFDEIETIEAFYPYLPAAPDPDEDGTREIELPGPYDELLVIDLSRDFIRKAMSIDAKDRLAIKALLDEEEAPLLENLLAHVRTFAPVQNRFARRSRSPRNT